MEEITDFQLSLRIAGHIKHPCGINLNGKDYNIRDFYLRLAKQTLPTLRDIYAKDFLESVIEMYE